MLQTNKILIRLAFLLVFTVGVGMGLNGFAQTNLVPNPSFETTTGCPTNFWDISLAKPWFSASTTTSPDLFDTCSHGGLVGVPLNALGSLTANTGAAYAGIYVFGGINYRKYLEVPLDSPLVGGHQYCLSFFVSLPDSFSLGITSFQAYFSKDSALEYSDAPLSDSVQPQLHTDTSLYFNQHGFWINANGSFMANGGEKFMTIGNFSKDKLTQTDSAVGGSYFYGGYSYYYIDDVSLTDCTPSGIAAISVPAVVKIWPNPTHDWIQVQFARQQDYRLSLYDVAGRKMLSKTTDQLEESISVLSLTKGIYFLKVEAMESGELCVKKIEVY